MRVAVVGCLARVARSRRGRAAAGLLLAAVACGLPAQAACERARSAAGVSIYWTMLPTPPLVGAATAEISLRDAERQPLEGASLQVVCHMSHPGMAPVMAAVAETGGGVYSVDLHFDMSGDWIVQVTGKLRDGRPINHRIDIPGVRASDR